MQSRHRLGSASLIKRVYAEGARTRSAVAAVAGLREGEDVPRVAVVASRKVGNAVARNRARRRLRAALDSCVGSMKPGSVAVVAATPATATVNFQKLVESVRESLRRVGLTELADA